MISKYLKIIFVFVFIIPFLSCKKITEDRLLGTWDRVFIEKPGGSTGNPNYFEHWVFRDSKTLQIIQIDRVTGDTTKTSSWEQGFKTGTNYYRLTSRKKMKIWSPDNPEGTASFDIIKINGKILRMIVMDGKLDGWNYEFIKLK